MSRGWGFETGLASTAATATTAVDPGVASGLYSFSANQRKVVVVNHPDSGVDLYVKWNAATAAKTGSAWNEVIEPGGRAEYPGEAGDAICTQVAIWADAAVTYGEDFVVFGWE